MLRTYFCYLDEAEIPTEKIKRVLPDVIQRVFLICSLLLLFFLLIICSYWHSICELWCAILVDFVGWIW